MALVPIRVATRPGIPVSRFRYYPAMVPVDPRYTRYRFGHQSLQDQLVGLGELDFSLKRAFRSVTRTVRQVGRVALRLVPGAVTGLVAGPAGAIAGAIAGYESARRAGRGRGLRIHGSELLKSMGYGAAAGGAVAAISGAVSSIAPATAAKLGIASPLGTTTGVYTTGIFPSVSHALFTAGAAPMTLLKSVGTLFAAKQALGPARVATETTLPSGPADYTAPPPRESLEWLQRAGSASVPAPAWSVPGVASDQGAQYFSPSVLPSSSGGFATPETVAKAEEPTGVPWLGTGILGPEGELFGIPITYLLLGGGGLLLLYMATRPRRAYARNPRRRRYSKRG